jgi:hypothetical protein
MPLAFGYLKTGQIRMLTEGLSEINIARILMFLGASTVLKQSQDGRPILADLCRSPQLSLGR